MVRTCVAQGHNARTALDMGGTRRRLLGCCLAVKVFKRER